MKINFITTFLITYLIQIPYIYTADAATECPWSTNQGTSCSTGKLVTYVFKTTDNSEYSLTACQTLLPIELPKNDNNGYIGVMCNSNKTNLPCYVFSGKNNLPVVYYVRPTFLVITFSHNVSSRCVFGPIQNICNQDPTYHNKDCPSLKQCYFTVNPRDTNFDIKKDCKLEVSTDDPNDPRLQFVRNGKIYSCATQLGEHAKFVKPFTVPIIESQEDGTIENPGGQNSLDDCVLKQGSKDSPYEDDAGQYIFTSGTCSDLYCTDITADLCGAVS